MTEQSVSGKSNVLEGIIALRASESVAVGGGEEFISVLHDLGFYPPAKVFYQIDDDKRMFRAPTQYFIGGTGTEWNSTIQKVRVDVTTRSSYINFFFFNNDSIVHTVKLYALIYADRSS